MENVLGITVHPHRYKAAVYVGQLQIHLRAQEGGYGRSSSDTNLGIGNLSDFPGKSLGDPNSFLSPFVCCVEVASILTDTATTSASALWDMSRAEPGV